MGLEELWQVRVDTDTVICGAIFQENMPRRPFKHLFLIRRGIYTFLPSLELSISIGHTILRVRHRHITYRDALSSTEERRPHSQPCLFKLPLHLSSQRKIQCMCYLALEEQTVIICILFQAKTTSYEARCASPPAPEARASRHTESSCLPDLPSSRTTDTHRDDPSR